MEVTVHATPKLSISRVTLYLQEKGPRFLVAGWMGLRIGLDVVVKLKICPRTPAMQLVSSRYTE